MAEPVKFESKKSLDGLTVAQVVEVFNALIRLGLGNTMPEWQNCDGYQLEDGINIVVDISI